MGALALWKQSLLLAIFHQPSTTICGVFSLRHPREQDNRPAGSQGSCSSEAEPRAELSQGPLSAAPTARASKAAAQPRHFLAAEARGRGRGLVPPQNGRRAAAAARSLPATLRRGAAPALSRRLPVPRAGAGAGAGRHLKPPERGPVLPRAAGPPPSPCGWAPPPPLVLSSLRAPGARAASSQRPEGKGGLPPVRGGGQTPPPPE